MPTFSSIACLVLLASEVGAVQHRQRPQLPPQQPASGHDYWAGKNGDAFRTGSSPFEAPSLLEGGPTWSFHEEVPEEAFAAHPEFAQFRSTLRGLVRAAPLIDGQRNIYLATVTSGHVHKFSPDGTKLWTHSARAQIPEVPAIMDGRLFAATDRGEVFALHMETGEKLWNTSVAPSIAGDTWSMTAGEGIVISAAGNADASGGVNTRLVALHALNGSTAWHFDAHGEVLYNILVSIKDGSCVFSTASGKVYRLDLHTGRVQWETPSPGWGFTTGGSIIGPDGVVYTTWNSGIGEGMVGAYDFGTGRRLWATKVGLDANNAPAVGRLGKGPELSVVIGVGKNPDPPNSLMGIRSGHGPEKRAQVVALDATTGKLRWKHSLPSWHGAALDDDRRPDICLPDAFSNPAIGGDGTVYVGFQSGHLYSVRDSDGDGHISRAEVSTFQTGAAFQGSPGIAPGMLAATPCNGLLVWTQAES